MSPSLGLLALSCGTFALGIAEFSMMGILSPLANSLHVSIPEAGDFITAYALGVSIGAPLPLFFRKRPLKHILLGLSCLIIFGNSFAACSPGYYTFLIARFISGLPHGAFFGVSAIVATNMVEPGRKASAVAIMVAGMTAANLAGVPIATWLTNIFSWRLTFVIAATFGLITLGGIYFFAPLEAPDKKVKLSDEFRFLKKGAPWIIFLATFLGQGSVYCWYSYMEPIMLQVTHIPAADMKYVMALTGFGMFIGNLSGGKLSDKFHPAIVTACVGASIVPILAGLYFLSAWAYIALPLAFLGAAALFALGGPMQYLIVRFSRGGEILGGAGIQIAFNSSNALSAYLGGRAIAANYGLTSPALLGIPMALVCSGLLFYFWRTYRIIDK